MSEIPPLPFPRPSAQSAIIIRRESTVSVTGHWALLWHPTPLKILKLVLTSVFFGNIASMAVSSMDALMPMIR